MSDTNSTSGSGEANAPPPPQQPRLTADQLRAAERIREYWSRRPASLAVPLPNPVPGGMESDNAASR